MSNEIENIKKPIVQELEVFEEKFKYQMHSKVALLDVIMNYIVKRKGKQMRPMFVLLCSKAFGEISEKTYRGAALVELLHTATLVHDDVVDDSKIRRGYFSINALWKNKIAVLVGDFLLSKGLITALKGKDYEILSILSEAIEAMSEGELLQIEKARRLDITETVYYDIITKKTASLISACCAVGACGGGANEEQIQLAKEFGLACGIAFQIKDDLFDYGDNDIGKPTGIDIKERKMTLPLIYALKHADDNTKHTIKKIVKNNNNNPQKVKYVIDFVLNSGGVEFTQQEMKTYHLSASQILDKFPESESKTSLKLLLDYVIYRKK